jgi:glucosamine-6-phosphate deaminase
MTTRKAEIRRLLRLTPADLLRRARGRLTICRELDELHRRFAATVADEIRTRNARGEPTRLILPVGPTGQYPLLVETINRERLDLRNCWFFFMDEYCDEHGRAVPARHPLSFRGCAERVFLSKLDRRCGLSAARVIFPGQDNIRRLARLIEQVGGIDTCYGGVGVHGHLAFNEPGPGVRDSGPRRVTLNDFTVTLNAIRAGVGGDLENFPRRAYTVGLKQILAARRIRLYCRNDIPGVQWANTVLRLALFGAPGNDYPVTWIRGRDYHVTTTKETAACPLAGL